MSNNASENRHDTFVAESVSVNQPECNNNHATFDTGPDSPEADANNGKKSTKEGDAKKKVQKMRFGSPKNLETINKFCELVSDNQPLDLAAQKCGITIKQAKKLLYTLMREKRVRDYRPPHTMMSAKKQIWQMFSALPVEFDEVKVSRNDDGSITVVPVKNS